MSQKILKNTFASITQIYFKIATGNVTKSSKKYICEFYPNILQNSHWKCHKKLKKKLPSLVQDILWFLPMEMLQKIQKNYFLLFVQGSQEFCHWICHKKFKNIFSLSSSRYSWFLSLEMSQKIQIKFFSLFVSDNQKFATGNVTKNSAKI